MSKRLPNVLLLQLKAEASEDPPKKLTKPNPETIARGICDLPSELLEIIMGNINICHHNCIRRTSKRLRDVSDMFAMSEFRKALHRHTNRNPSSYESAVLKVIEHATEVYVRSGLGSTFCGCILPMLRNSQKEPFYPGTRQIERFLMHFYGMVDELLGDTYSQRSLLLHNLTLMRFFTKFDKSIISSTTMPLYWRTIFELEGFWFGTFWRPKPYSFYQRTKLSNILVMFSEMLIAKITGMAFIRVWKSLNETYVFGNRMKKGKIPKTYFAITVYGSKKICLLLRSCLEDPSDQFTWPSKWPKDQFSIHLDIICHEAPKWGCSKSQHMEFGPFTGPAVCRDTEHHLNL